MSHYEDLGAGLVLLSLDDIGSGVTNTPSQSHFSHDDYDDDGMDIDSDSLGSDQLEEMNAEDQVSDSDIEDDANTLLVNILSPTSLGVHYALKNRLLMPPPDTSNTELDYEFDTSNALSQSATSVINRPNRTTFEPVAVASIFIDNNPGHQRVLVEEPEIYENSMNRSFQYRRQMLPASYSVVHHHHYYGAQTGFHLGSEFQVGSAIGSRLGSGIGSELGTSLGSGSCNPVPGLSNGYSGELDDSNYLKLASTTPSQNRIVKGMHSLQTQDIVLPSPWDSHLMPAERTPYLFSLYLQLIINLSLTIYTGHLLVGIVGTIKQDVSYKLATEANNLLVEIALCERSYQENHCHPDSIVPALEKMCAHWEKCMKQDPFRGGNKSLVSAHTIAMIVNLLIEPLSFKVLFVFASALLLVFVSNFAFGYVRAKSYYGWHAASLN